MFGIRNVSKVKAESMFVTKASAAYPFERTITEEPHLTCEKSPRNHP